jgi:non-specific serine/threonine protein kinase
MRQCFNCHALYDDRVRVCPVDGIALPPPDPLLGTTIDGKYRIEALLGRGGMGAVYRARQLSLERDVAVKVLPSDFVTRPKRRERFKREALAIARLKHPHIVSVYDYAVSAEVGAYLVLEHVAGRALDAEIRQRGRIPVSAALDLMRQIASAVQAAHEAGIVHRDLKPGNVLLEIAAGGAVLAKVLDFGIAKMAMVDETGGGVSHARITADGDIVGTPAYMSPEQCVWEPADARSDVYSMGCVLYEMVAGRPPFVADRAQMLIYKHVTEDADAVSRRVEGAPAGLDAVVAKALEKRPEDRYQTAAEWGRALAALRATLDPDLSFPPVLMLPTEELATVALATGEREPAPRTPTAYVTRESVAHNLPHEATSFVGRERDLAEVEHLLETFRLVTLLGPGGIGKTRLALQAAARAVATFEDGVWFVDLAPLAEPTLVAKAVAAAAGVREETNTPILDTLERHFAAERVLIVLDNCEHMVGACAELVERLLRTCGHLRVLATSQAILGLGAETVYRVAPLALAGERAGAECEAVSLFVDRARQQAPGFRLTDENAGVIAGICERLEGIPLAIELAAARARVLTVEQIAARLEDRFRLLAGPGRGGPARHQTLRAALDWSYNLLSEGERGLLGRLSVFAGSWTLDAVEAIATGHASSWELLDEVTQLVDKSLVNVETQGSEVRYRLLETIRQYASERLAEAGEAERLHAAHRDYYLELAERAAPELMESTMGRWFDRLELEHDNLRAAMAWSAGQADGAVALLRLANALYRFWHVRGYLTEARAWYERGFDAGAEIPPAILARALYSLGTIESIFGEYERAEARQEEALALQRATGDEANAAFTLNSLGGIAYYTGDYRKALKWYEQCVACFRTLGLESNLASVLTNLAMIVRNLGDCDRAEGIYDEALTIGRSLGHDMVVARALMGRGIVATERGAYDRAALLFDEALAIFRRLGDRRMAASVLNNLGDVARFQGERNRAAELYGEAVATHLGVGDQPNAVYSLASFASLAVDDGRVEDGLRLAGAFEALRESFGLRLNPFEKRDYDTHLERAREAAGARADDLLAAGASLSLDEAVAFAAACVDTKA